MRKATAIYHAPEGDSDTVEMGGAQFKDGEAVELNSDDHPHLMSKIEGNKHFEVDMGEDDNKPRRGRPPKTRDLKAGIEEARDHDFEADRRANLERRNPTDNPAPKPVEEPTT